MQDTKSKEENNEENNSVLSCNNTETNDSNKGFLIVIEGTDSSGKETQTKLLYDGISDLLANPNSNLKRKIANNYRATTKISFPDYNSRASEPIKMYLAGEFGSDASKVNPYPISLMYAVDRYASFHTDWKNSYDNKDIIITDRYVTSNMIYQSTKISAEIKKQQYLEWLDDLEYEKNKLPRPDMVIFLNMPPKQAQLLMKNRKNKITNSSKKDIHESNSKYLNDTYESTCKIAKQYDWTEINCVDSNDNLKSIDTISNEIFDNVIKKLSDF